MCASTGNGCFIGQWAELEAIYRTAPVAMMLIDAKDFRILRLNEKQAELLGLGVAELLGKPLLKVRSRARRVEESADACAQWGARERPRR